MKPNFDLAPGVILRSFETMPPSILQEGTVIAKYKLDGFVSGMAFGVTPNLKTNFGCPEPPVACHPTDTFDRRLAEMINAVGSVIVAFEKDF